MTEEINKVRVRFAPSPTGHLHIGGARTALFNWIYARKMGGKFLLRIEDTDLARSSPEMVAGILGGLRWLGLDWEEEPLFQSRRISLHQKAVDRLVKSGRAYHCFCSPELLEQKRRVAVREKKDYRYDGTCRHLSPELRAKYLQEGRPSVIRFQVLEGEVSYKDGVFNKITVDGTEIDDFILIRRNGQPTYNLTVVVDDHDMGITHVIRGADHITNTPKQLLLYRAFGWEPPFFAHLPLILGPDRKRLSKRHGATSLEEYRQQGYFPETVRNYLALLGWSPGDDREVMTLSELISAFDLSGISPSNAIFDEQKLEWMNGIYLRRKSEEDLVQDLYPYLKEWGIQESSKSEMEYVKKVVELLKNRVKKTPEFVEAGTYFFKDPTTYDPKAVRKFWGVPHLTRWFSLLVEALEKIDPFDEGGIETVIRGLAEGMGVKAAAIIHPARIALTGRGASPGIFEVMVVLGKDRVVRRLRKALDYLSRSN